jgi:transporter family protein
VRWLPFAVLAALALSLADFFIKQAANKISSSLGMLVYGACAFSVGLAWVAGARWSGSPVFAQRQGLGWAVAAGLAFSTVTIGLYLAFAAGARISIASPAIRITGLLLAATLGILVLREPITIRYAAGMALAVAGLALIIFR